MLGRKSELQQAWERHQQHARQKEREEEDTKKTTEFQRRLNDQAAKINKVSDHTTKRALCMKNSQFKNGKFFL